MTRTSRPFRSRHGTTSGFHAHARRDERPCDACYRAKQEYDERRRDAPEHVRAGRLRARAQRGALIRLKNIYPVLYRLLYVEELRRIEREEAVDLAGYAASGGEPAPADRRVP